MKCALQPRAGFKWCSIMFAVSEAVPAELGASFSVLIFIKTAIDFNCSVNRHAPTLLPASCVHPHSVSISSSLASPSFPSFCLFLLSSLTTMLCCHTLQNVPTAATTGVSAKDADRLSFWRLVEILRAVERNTVRKKMSTLWEVLRK